MFFWLGHSSFTDEKPLANSPVSAGIIVFPYWLKKN
jgi:hypothetical protein